jgi:ATP-dependent Clp protease protease subunit
LNNLYAFHTGQALTQIKQVMDRDTFMDTEQALTFGIIDEILLPRQVEEEDNEKYSSDSSS